MVVIQPIQLQIRHRMKLIILTLHQIRPQIRQLTIHLQIHPQIIQQIIQQITTHLRIHLIIQQIIPHLTTIQQQQMKLTQQLHPKIRLLTIHKQIQQVIKIQPQLLLKTHLQLHLHPFQHKLNLNLQQLATNLYK